MAINVLAALATGGLGVRKMGLFLGEMDLHTVRVRCWFPPYCHGGGMSHYSCFYSNFQTLGRLLAHAGALVLMPDFRNSETPSLAGEATGPFPAGLLDCAAAARWAQANLVVLLTRARAD